MTQAQEVLYNVTDRVATLTINRPKARNSLNSGVITTLNRFLDQAAADPAIGSIIITGAGGKAFCAGADLGNTFSTDAGFLETHDARGEMIQLFQNMNKCKKPILGAVNGYCLAGGVGLCASCDLVIATADSQFGLPEIKRGLWPYVVTAILIRNIGRKKTLELCMTGNFISAAEAKEIGLINYTVPKEEFSTAVEKISRKIGSFSSAIMGLGKSSFYTIADMDFNTSLEFLKSQITLNTQTEDIKEGIAAFMEKRKPVWQGK